jgi:hypothetical protein
VDALRKSTIGLAIEPFTEYSSYRNPENLSTHIPYSTTVDSDRENTGQRTWKTRHADVVAGRTGLIGGPVRESREEKKEKKKQEYEI